MINNNSYFESEHGRLLKIERYFTKNYIIIQYKINKPKDHKRIYRI